jgi:hypothetical protein
MKSFASSQMLPTTGGYQESPRPARSSDQFETWSKTVDFTSLSQTLSKPWSKNA